MAAYDLAGAPALAPEDERERRRRTLALAEGNPIDTRVPDGPPLIERAFWLLFLYGAIGGFFRDFPQIDRVIWLAADGYAVYLIARHPKLYGDLVWRTMPFILWAMLAIVSALWSLAPFTSAYHGLQLLMTILVGIVVLARLGLDRFVFSIFLACGAALAISVVEVMIGRHPAALRGGEWIGIFTHKNVFGFVSVLFLYSAGVLAMRASRWRLAYLAAAVVGLGLVAASQSGTSIIAATALSALIVGQAVYRRGNGTLVLAVGLGLVAMAAAGFYVVLAELRLLDAYFDATGKDATLTGRTILWDFGLNAFMDRPLLGHGFKGYWESDVTTKAYLHFFMQQRLWFFHNNFIEVMVGFGLLGLALFVATLALVYGRILAMFVQAPTPGAAWCLCVAAHIFIMMMSENPLWSNHSLTQLLIVSVYLSAIMRKSALTSARPRARVRRVPRPA